MTSRRNKEPLCISHRSYASVRRRAPKPNSLILRHYALFTSLSRYTLSPPPPQSAPDHRERVPPYKRAQLRQNYPVPTLWAQKWPLAPSKFHNSHKTPQEDLDAIVETIVKHTFDSDYQKFRSPEWAKKHKIRAAHTKLIVVHDTEVKASAEAAKDEVNKALRMFVSAVKRREIGIATTRASRSKPNPAGSGSQQVEQPSKANGVVDDSNIQDDAHIDDGLDEDIYGENRDPEKPLLGWRALLDHLQASCGSSRSAQWRHWHLLNAIKRTRQQCEQLFPHQADQPSCSS